MKTSFLVSGMLGENVLKYFISKIEIPFVLTDKESYGIIELCRGKNIPCYVGNPRNEKIKSFTNDLECDVIASVNYLFIVDQNIINLASGLIFNIHGSLLPKYRGRTPHVWAIINGEKNTGITAHVIDQGCDTGAIIKQIPVHISPNDTGAMILQKFNNLYIDLVEDVLKMYNSGSIRLIKQDESKATFFGKRTPDDGRINWNWSVERIINWIRAQSHPYPGAFTILEDTKIIIDKASCTDFGFHYMQENGTILSSEPMVVKCGTGAVKIDIIRNENLIYSINQILK